MKFLLYKLDADPARFGSSRFVRVREGFENHVHPGSVSFKSDIESATRFDTHYQATLWQAALANGHGRIEIIEVTS